MKYAGSTTESTAVYIVGGNVPPYRNAFRYDITSNIWKKLDNIIKIRHYFPCVFVLDDTLCVVGGRLGSEYISSMECLDIENKNPKWQLSQAMLHEVSHTSCVTVGSSVILTGGKNNNRLLSSVYKWTTSGGWISLASMKSDRCGHCTVTDGTRYLYVVSGQSTTSVERYDIVKDVWMGMAPLPRMIYYHACLYLNGTIIATGGYNKKDIYFYSVRSNTWTQSTVALQEKIYGHTMAILL